MYTACKAINKKIRTVQKSASTWSSTASMPSCLCNIRPYPDGRAICQSLSLLMNYSCSWMLQVHLRSTLGNHLVALCLQLNIWIKAVYIPGTNEIGDALSCFQFARFWELVPMGHHIRGCVPGAPLGFHLV